MANSLWIDAVRQGLAASKPTVPDLADDTFGFYYETDTGLLKMWDSVSAAWVTATVASAVGAAASTAATDVTATYASGGVVKLTLTLDGVVAAVADADDFGSAELCTLPDRNLMVLAVEVDLELVKDGVGFIDATDLDVALGTAAASNTTLSAGMVDLVAKVDLNAADLSPALQVHTLAATPAPLGILDGATNKVYLNVSGPTETGEDATITATGTVEIYYIDLGNTTS